MTADLLIVWYKVTEVTYVMETANFAFFLPAVLFRQPIRIVLMIGVWLNLIVVKFNSTIIGET